jgi:hypothetical protein
MKCRLLQLHIYKYIQLRYRVILLYVNVTLSYLQKITLRLSLE